MLPFARDWLGPRDELVPFGAGAPREGGTLHDEPDRDEDTGPAASAAAPERDEPRLRSVPRAPGPRISDVPAPPYLDGGDSPPSASDFWGEHSDEIHGVLQGPAPAIEVLGRDGEATGPAAARGRRLRVSSGRWRRWAGRAGERTRRAVASVQGLRLPRRPIPRPPRRPIPRPLRGPTGARRVFVAGTIAVACVAVAVAALGTSPGGRGAGAIGTDGTASVSASGLEAGIARLIAGSSALAAPRQRASGDGRQTKRRTVRVARVARPKGKPGTAGARHAPASPAPSEAAASAYSHPLQVSSPSTSSGGAGSAGSSGSAGGSGSSGGSESSSGSGGGGSAPAGPVGAGAPFGPGHLG